MDAPQYLLDCVLAPAFYRSHAAALYSKDYAHEKNSSPFLHARYARASTLNFFGPQCLKTPAPLWSHSDKPPLRYKTLMKSLTMTVRACHYPHIPPLIDHVEKKIAPFYPCFFETPIQNAMAPLSLVDTDKLGRQVQIPRRPLHKHHLKRPSWRVRLAALFRPSVVGVANGH